MQGIDYIFFERLFETGYRRLVLFAKRYVDSEEEARDIVQDCFVKLWERRQDVEEDSAKALVYMMVRNRCLNALKHKAVVVDFESSFLQQKGGSDNVFDLDFNNSPEQISITDELDRIIRTEVDRLSPKCREIFILSRFKGLRNNEIAVLKGISEPAVHYHLEKALSRLRKKLKF